MKTKLEMAHEWYMKYSESPSFMNTEVEMAWQYADAMQAEADKRGEEEIDKWSDELSNILKLSKFKPLELQPDSKEWQPDWSQAPEWANWWAMDKSGQGIWHNLEPSRDQSVAEWVIDFSGGSDFSYKVSPDFNYTGDWRDSLRKRPQ